MVVVLDDKRIWRDCWAYSLRGVEVLLASSLGEVDSHIDLYHEAIRAGVFDLCVPTIESNSLEAARKLRRLAGSKVFLVGSTSEERFRHYLDDARLDESDPESPSLFNEVLVKEKNGLILESIARIIKGTHHPPDKRWVQWLPELKCEA